MLNIVPKILFPTELYNMKLTTKQKEYFLKPTCKFTDLKKRGYRFEKLYARNYKVYHKEMDNHDIWLWVAHGGSIEIDGWGQRTKRIVNFINANLNNFRQTRFGEFLTIWINKHSDEMIIAPIRR